MLSINIPVFNVEVYNLVLQLIQQARKLNIDFEIRVYDDASDDEEIKVKNRKINDFEEVVYFESEKNLGRSAIRNRMGEDSRFEYLLFIDSDSELCDTEYLNNFSQAKNTNSVICGGTAYKNEKPEKEKILRWIYGNKREAILAETRNSKKGFIITSNNFMIEKSVFEKIHFRDEVNAYGHEDTLLGFDLYSNGIEIVHINNPVYHIGLETSEEFLSKTRTSLLTLFYITNELLKNDKEFIRQVFFLNRYQKITSVLPIIFLRLFFHIFNRIIVQNLLSKNPSLFLFDIYKLCYYSTIKKPHPKN